MVWIATGDRISLFAAAEDDVCRTKRVESLRRIPRFLQIWANAASTHMAFPTTFFTVPGTIGPVHLGLVASDGTLTDVNDIFTVAVIY
jgi:hypothetical protein